MLFAHGQKFLNHINNRWCEGKYSRTINKVYTKEKPLRFAEFGRVFKIHVA